MSKIRIFAALLALSVAIGCRAQAPASTPGDADNHRRIENAIRSHFGLTPDITVTLGASKPSNIPGYEAVTVTLARDGQSQNIDFLISSDGNTLARLQTFDLDKDPMFHIDIANRPIRGNPEAKVTVISFDDLECPYCARMHQSLFPAALNRYKDKVRFIYKDFPLLSIHPWAMHAAVDAECIAAQNGDAYWRYVDYVHAHGAEINGEKSDETFSFAALDRIAREQSTSSHLDLAKLSTCLQAQDETTVRRSLDEATKLGLEGAPALFINGERINGALPAPYIWMAIDRALRDAGIEPPPAPDATPQSPDSKIPSAPKPVQ